MLAQDPDAVLAVLTADQVIEPADTFQKGLAAAYAAVEREPEALLTFAIEPTFPATGYGWVERREEVAPGVFAVDRFVEKPDLETATALLADGGFGWNSGMFVFRADTFLSALRAYFGEGVDRLIEIGKGWAEGRGTECWRSIGRRFPRRALTTPSWNQRPRRSISRSYRAAARGLARSGQLAQPRPGAEC